MRLVFEAAGVVVVLVVQLLQIFIPHLLVKFRRPCRVLESVILKLYLSRPYLCAACQAADGRFTHGVDFTGLIRDDYARRHRTTVIGKDQRVAPVTAFEEVENTLFRG